MPTVTKPSIDDKACAAAAQVRRATQDRIVFAFGEQIRGLGAGPTDADLRLFARMAVVEQRMLRGIDHASAEYADSSEGQMRPAPPVSPGQ